MRFLFVSPSLGWVSIIKVLFHSYSCVIDITKPLGSGRKLRLAKLFQSFGWAITLFTASVKFKFEPNMFGLCDSSAQDPTLSLVPTVPIRAKLGVLPWVTWIWGSWLCPLDLADLMQVEWSAWALSTCLLCNGVARTGLNNICPDHCYCNILRLRSDEPNSL